MKMFQILVPCIAVVAICLGLLVWAIDGKVVPSTGIPADVVVAERAGKQITYIEIAMKPESLELLAQGGWDRTRIRDYQKESEFANLKRILEDAIVSEAVVRLNIRPSSEAVNARAAEITQRYYGKPTLTEEDTREQNEAIQSMNRLLQVWQANHEEGETLYKKEFSERIKPSQWEKLKKQYPTAQSLEALKRRQPTVNAKAMNEWIARKAAQQVTKDELVKKTQSTRRD